MDRFEVRTKEPLSPTTQAILALLGSLLPVMTAIVGGLWVVFTYLDHQKETQRLQTIQAEKDNKTRLIEARKPFLDKQLALYVEIAQVTGKLVSIPNKEVGMTGNWEGGETRFYQLYFELAMVWDDEVKSAMVEFQRNLAIFKDFAKTHNEPVDNSAPPKILLQTNAFQLAQTLGFSIRRTWNLQ